MAYNTNACKKLLLSSFQSMEQGEFHSSYDAKTNKPSLDNIASLPS